MTYQEADTTHAFRSLHGKSRKADLPATYASTFICASAFGWFLMASPHRKAHFLLNPITGACIGLPPWPIPSSSCLSSPACISSSPTDPNCLVAFMISNEVVACRLDAYRPQWSITPTDEDYGQQFEMVGCKGHVYVLTNRGKLGVIGGGEELELTWLIDASPDHLDGWGYDLYLVESSDEILMIYREGEYLTIYKANFVRGRWKRIRGLDADRVLFLGHGSSFSASTADIGGSGNLIYILRPADEEEKYRNKMKVLRRQILVQVAPGVQSWRNIAGSTKVVTVPSSNSFWLLRYRRHFLRYGKKSCKRFW